MLDPTESSQTVVQAFIAKLWHMVSDSNSDNLIAWGKDGTTFVIKDHNKFSSELLPMYYKHNNMASFIRQLNMYNFHKVLLFSSSLNNQKDLEFSHPNFIKNQPNLLTKIQRKNNSKEQSEVKGDPVVINNLLKEVKQLRAIHEIFANKLNVMKKENAALWREHSILRQRHAKQEKIVNKVIHFLISMVQQSSINVTRRKVPLMIKDRPILKPHKKKYVKLVNAKTQPVIIEASQQDILNDAKGQTEEVLPEELLLSCTESDYDEDTPTVSNTNNQNTMSKLQTQIKLELPDSNEELEQQKHKVVHMKNRIGKKRKFDETKSSNNSLQPDLDETRTLSPASSFAESVPSPEYLFIDSNDGITQLLQISEVGKTKAVPEGNKVYTQDISNEPQGTVHSSQINVIENNKVLNDPTLIKSEMLAQNVQEPSQNYILVTSPLPIVVSPAPSVSSPPQNISVDMTAGTSSDYLKENSASPSDNTLLQLAKPTDFPENINSKESVELHLDKVQSDLDILKDLLKGEGISLDANMVFELFNDNPMDLNMGLAGQNTSPQMFQDPSGSEQALISYTPSLLDFDTDLPIEPDVMPSQIDDEVTSDYALNTPQIRTQSPSFPDQS